MTIYYDQYDDHRIDAEADAYYEDLVKRISKSLYKMFLLVEGESEEIYFGEIFKEIVESNNMVIANYNGINNLASTVRIICNTLNSNTPIIVTYDNDVAGRKEITKVQNLLLNKNIINNEYLFFFEIPLEKKISYDNSHLGGSFEEMFEFEDFVEACFSEEVLPMKFIEKKEMIIRGVNIKKPWIMQIKKQLAIQGYKDFCSKKTMIAKILASNKTKPHTVSELEKLILKVRKENSIHPDLFDAEL